MTDRIFTILNDCMRDAERFGGSFEEEIVKAYVKYESTRGSLSIQQFAELDEILSDLSE